MEGKRNEKEIFTFGGYDNGSCLLAYGFGKFIDLGFYSGLDVFFISKSEEISSVYSFNGSSVEGNRNITVTDECELKTDGTYELPLFSYETWKELSPGVWSAGSLKVEIKASGELEIFEDVPDLPWRTDKKARRLNCKFKNKSKTFRTTVTYSLL